MSNDIACRVNRGVASVECGLRIEQGLEHLVVDNNRLERSPAGLGMIGSERRNRFSDVAHDVGCEDRLILIDQAVTHLARHILSGDDCLDSADLPRRGNVYGSDPRIRIRGTQGRAPEATVSGEI